MSNGLLHALDVLESIKKEAPKLTLEDIATVLRIEQAEQAKLNASRRSSEEEIGKIDVGVARIFADDPNTELTTKEMAKEIGVPFKQGNLGRISRKVKILRLTYQQQHQQPDPTEKKKKAA